MNITAMTALARVDVDDARDVIQQASLPVTNLAPFATNLAAWRARAAFDKTRSSQEYVKCKFWARVS